MDFGQGVFEVISTSGDTQLGGKDMDSAVINHIITTFKQESGIDVSADKMALDRVREEQKKQRLNFLQQ